VAEYYVDSFLSVDGSTNSAKIMRFSTPDEYISHVSSQEQVRQKYNLTPEYIAGQLTKTLLNM